MRLFAPRRAATVLLLGTLAGCATTPAPVPAARSPVPNYTEYPVQRGETLYSIGAKLNVDPKELARWNSINPPYLIRPGQKLKIQAAASALPAAAPKGSDEVVVNAVQPASSAPSNASGGFFGWFGGGSPSSATRSSDDPFAEVRPGGVRTTPATTPSAPRVESYSPTPGRAPGVEQGNAWQWPVVGASRVHRSEDGQVQGVRIQAGVGQPVYAARDGKVTFVNTFPGYGELLVIEHDGDYLSAYGFIRKPKVTQDQTVRRGTVVAEIGEGSEGELHFEIRRDGKPLDPGTLLPRNP